MSNRIAFAVAGSYGDVHPFIALAVEMARRGWRPVLLAAQDYAEKAAAAGLDFAPMRPGWAEAASLLGLTPERLLDRMARDDEFWIREGVFGMVEEAFADAREVIAGARLAVVSHFTPGAHIAADLAKVPKIVVALQPMMLISAHDPPATKTAPWLPGFAEAFGPGAARTALALGFWRQRGLDRPARRLRTRLGLPPRVGDWLSAGVRDAVATIGAWSPLMGALQPDHPPGAAITGALYFDDEIGANDPRVAAFLDSGAPPAVLTLGSFAARAPRNFYHAGVDAARAHGLRVLVVGGPKPPPSLVELAGPDVCVTAYARYSEVFPRARVVVHHGGIGTCHQALRAGAPQLVAPFLGDQLDNALRLKRLGVGGCLPVERWTAKRASGALAAMLEAAPARRAVECALAERAEDGVARAGDIVEAAAQSFRPH